MYNVVFWDFIPTLVAHKYYCETQAGFWVYKTPEQWGEENLGAVETLKQSLEPDPSIEKRPGNIHRYWLTQRFYDDVLRLPISHALSIEQKVFSDAKTGAIIAKSIIFWRGKSGAVFGLGGSPDELRQALVLGWEDRQCNVEGKSPTDTFDQYIYQFWKWGENK